MNRKFWGKKRVTVTGGAGFLGSHLVARLKKGGVGDLLVPRAASSDLRLLENCMKVCKKKDVVIHLAGLVGGIGFNREHPGRMFYDNIIMGVYMLEAARRCGVKKFIGIGTICSYPKFTPVPFKENNLWSGYPEETNAPFGLAKKMLIVGSEAYRKEYGFNSINLLPVNMYGPGDKWDPRQSHVIPALIRKALMAKEKKRNELVVWGTGRATREFLYVEDAAEAIILAGEKYNKSGPCNLGSGKEISIKKLVELICEIVGYKGKIIFDKTKPDGQPRRCLDTKKAEREFGFKAKTDFHKGLKKTIEWYKFKVK